MVKEKGLEAIWNEGICYVKHEDYLEVVEEIENIQKSFDMMRNLKDEKFRDVLKLEKENERIKRVYKTDVTYQREEIKSLYKQLVDERELILRKNRSQKL